ncbi:DUF4405 domain-containing protein [Methylovirgula ligni]|uniref:Uncharacterized protein DUF4405 n=1 Tax=Methylovirgula ligni TaxID=569860 RepID=A0A3D9Z3T1_9HYPH|nr:DUF4405 domain-containing protein [Methylovirgula ligni]QAY95678.1 DUF4405 domain-containing protein [Methylovirgula ligni]REF88958.1 uncharacterized protein DUF4405 [Methylovirgula ligni]
MSTSGISGGARVPPAPGQENSFGRFISRFATPLTAGLFLISAISGTALFFHWTPGTFHEMHEWLSLVLLAAFAFHLYKNWVPLLGYVRRGTLILPLAVCLIAAMPFVIPGVGGHNRGNPAFRLVPLLTHARLSDLAPVLKTTPDELIAALKKRGLTVRAPNETIEAVAIDSDKEVPEVLFSVIPGR